MSIKLDSSVGLATGLNFCILLYFETFVDTGVFTETIERMTDLVFPSLSYNIKNSGTCNNTIR